MIFQVVPVAGATVVRHFKGLDPFAGRLRVWQSVGHGHFKIRDLLLSERSVRCSHQPIQTWLSLNPLTRIEDVSELEAFSAQLNQWQSSNHSLEHIVSLLLSDLSLIHISEPTRPY